MKKYIIGVRERGKTTEHIVIADEYSSYEDKTYKFYKTKRGEPYRILWWKEFDIEYTLIAEFPIRQTVYIKVQPK